MIEYESNLRLSFGQVIATSPEGGRVVLRPASREEESPIQATLTSGSSFLSASTNFCLLE